jgi:hypothetical protein
VAAKNTVFAHMAKELGLMEATRVQMYLTWWAMFMLAHDREPMDIEEMAAELTAVSAATLYRRQASFRKAFPRYDTPAPLVEDAWEQMRARRERKHVPTPREWRHVAVT